MKTKRFALGALALLMAAGTCSAQTRDPLRQTVEQAVNTNPEVTARFNAYRASVDAVDVARAAYLPRVDLNASVARDYDRFNGRLPQEGASMTRHQVGLNLTQLL